MKPTAVAMGLDGEAVVAEDELNRWSLRSKVTAVGSGSHREWCRRRSSPVSSSAEMVGAEGEAPVAMAAVATEVILRST